MGYLAGLLRYETQRRDGSLRVAAIHRSAAGAGPGPRRRSGSDFCSYIAPEDFGELHEIFAVVDGAEVARGGFRIKLAAFIEPAEGPVGTPVTVTVTGMAAKLFSGTTLALRYDNAYTGVLTATTTRGTAGRVPGRRAGGSAHGHAQRRVGASVPQHCAVAVCLCV